jgi:hypothetical protein
VDARGRIRELLVAEVLRVDCWLDGADMHRWYAAVPYDDLGPIFTGAPLTSAWTAAGRDWIEW